jgi:hypothetical protein
MSARLSLSEGFVIRLDWLIRGRASKITFKP